METEPVLSPILEPSSSMRVLTTRERGSRDLACRHLAGVSSLLTSHQELRGVHAWADIVEESVRWSA